MTASSSSSKVASRLATIKLCATLASQATVAALVTIANKRVLNERAAPSTLLFLQQIVILLGYEFTSLIFGSEADRLPWAAKKQLVIATIPLAVLNCLALVLKTICLQHVPAAIYQIVRGLLIPFTVLLSFAILSSRPGLVSAGGLVIIMTGFFLSCSPSALISASVFGMTMGVVSSAATALYIVVMKLITARKSWKDTAGNISTFNIAYYNTLVTGAALGLVAIFTESSDLVEVLFQESWYQNGFLIGVLGSGLLSGLLAVLTIAQVKLTSPTAHMVSASVRGSLQSGLALVAFPAEAKAFTLTALSSTILIVVGGGCFAIGESLKARPAQAQESRVFSDDEVAMEEKEQSESRTSSEALLFDSSVEDVSEEFRDSEKV